MQTAMETPTGIDIDFLPEQYREQDAQRKVRTWRVAMVGVLMVALPIASFAQFRMRRSVESEIAGLAQKYTTTEQDTLRLRALEAERQQADSVARLLTYLRHPWRRSQVLSALLPALPDSITLTSVQLELVGGTNNALPLAAHNPHQENEPEAAAMRPADRALIALRARHDGARVELIVAGIAADPAQLHLYLGELSRGRLFVKAELISLESVVAAGPRASDAAKEVRFRARLVLSRGYGQPQGPPQPSTDVAKVQDVPENYGAHP